MKEYAIYPFECMRITQRHDEGNHLPHWYNSKNYSDKPIDEACEDGGRGYFVPKNDYRIVEKLGNQTNGYSIRLETTNKVYIPYQDTPVILEITLTHINKDDFDKVKVGQIIHNGEKILREGTSGLASGNHLHCTFNIDKYYGMKENSNKKWVFCYEKSLTPVEAFYVDDSVKIENSKGYVFKQVPSQYVGEPVERNTKIDQIEIIIDNLRARKEPSLNGAILGYINKGFYDIQDKANADNYDWYKVQDMWIAYSKDWENIYKHEETKEEIQQEYMNRILENIPKFLESLIEK